jgi:hypothetical protein
MCICIFIHAMEFKSDLVITTVTLEAIIPYGPKFYNVIPIKDRIRLN